MGTTVQVLWGPASLINWNVPSDTNYDLDDADDKVAVRFCVPRDGTIDRVGFYIMAVSYTHLTLPTILLV